MAKITFSSLKVKTKEEVKEITINDKVIEVKQYLAAADKNSLLEIVVQQADQGTILNTFAVDLFFDLYVVFMYTNLSFTDAQKEDPLKLYDILETNGIINAVIEAIPEQEYTYLKYNLERMVEDYLTYRNSARALVEKFSMFAPVQADGINEALKDFDVDKMKAVLGLAEETGIAND